jgi:hypothetical protein
MENILGPILQSSISAETFRINFRPRILDKFQPKNNLPEYGQEAFLIPAVQQDERKSSEGSHHALIIQAEEGQTLVP